MPLPFPYRTQTTSTPHPYAFLGDTRPALHRTARASRCHLPARVIRRSRGMTAFPPLSPVAALPRPAFDAAFPATYTAERRIRCCVIPWYTVQMLRPAAPPALVHSSYLASPYHLLLLKCETYHLLFSYIACDFKCDATPHIRAIFNILPWHVGEHCMGRVPSCLQA